MRPYYQSECENKPSEISRAQWPPAGVRPYYLDNSVCIILGDCREILPHVSADVLITDPPYGVGLAGYTIPDSDIGIEIVTAALKKVARGAVFTGNRLLHRYPQPSDIGACFCPAGAGVGPWGFGCFNPVLFYGKRPTPPRTPASLMSYDRGDDVAHPCPKPMDWMRWIVGLASLEGEIILDPFAGSGTTLRAAKDLGRKAIGIEIEERYCETAARRCAQETLDLNGGPACVEPPQQLSLG